MNKSAIPLFVIAEGRGVGKTRLGVELTVQLKEKFKEKASAAMEVAWDTLKGAFQFSHLIFLHFADEDRRMVDKGTCH
jgi:hypothetical protein